MPTFRFKKWGGALTIVVWPKDRKECTFGAYNDRGTVIIAPTELTRDPQSGRTRRTGSTYDVYVEGAIASGEETLMVSVKQHGEWLPSDSNKIEESVLKLKVWTEDASKPRGTIQLIAEGE